MADPSVASPAPSFPQAMEITAHWLELWDRGEISDEVLADQVRDLVVRRDGARGFFVTAMTSEIPLMDRLPEPLLAGLRQVGEDVVELTAKNLAMSAAMAFHHRQGGDLERMAGSERVMMRSSELLRQLEPNLVKQHLDGLLEATEGKGEHVAFLERNNYNQQHCEAIAAAILAVADAA